MRRQSRHDAAIAAVAARQGGVVSRRQLRAIGLSDGAIDHRVRCGRLHRVHPSVFAVGHSVLGVVGRRWSAVLACGGGAVLSDAAAAAAHGFRRSDAVRLDVTVPRGRCTPKAAIRIHWRALDADERTTLHGLPITTPARTLLDLAAGGLRGPRLATTVDRALLTRVLDFADLRRTLGRHRRRPGAPALREALERYAGGDTRSELEDIVVALCAGGRMARPQQNVVVEGRVRDFYWPAQRLVVEADSYAWHRSPTVLDDDRERDVELSLAGYRTLRFTYAQVTRRRLYVIGAIKRAIVSR